MKALGNVRGIVSEGKETEKGESEMAQQGRIAVLDVRQMLPKVRHPSASDLFAGQLLATYSA